MSLNYGTSAIIFVLKTFPFPRGLLSWSPSHKSCYGHFADNIRESISAYELDLTVFVFPKITMSTFIVIGSGTKFFHGITIALLSANLIFCEIYHYFRVTFQAFLDLINFV